MDLHQFIICVLCFSILITICSSMEIPHVLIDGPSRAEVYEPLMDTPELLEAYFNQPAAPDLNHVSQASKRDISTLACPTLDSVSPDQGTVSKKRQRVSVTSEIQNTGLSEGQSIHQGELDIPLSIETLDSFPPITDDFFDLDLDDPKFHPFYNSKHHKTNMLQLSQDSQKEIISYGVHHPFAGSPSQSSNANPKVKNSESKSKTSHTRLRANRGNGGFQHKKLSSSNTYFKSSKIHDDRGTDITLRNMVYNLPKIGLLEIQNHKSLGQEMTSWFKLLEERVGLKVQRLSIPEREIARIWPKVSDAIELANIRLTTSFFACLKFVYLGEPGMVYDIYTSGWKFISKILGKWKSLNLKTVLKREVKSILKMNQKVDATFLFSYMVSLPRARPISLTYFWKLCNSWEDQLSDQEKSFQLKLSFSDFSQRVLSGVKKE
ncbi:hypothetical protein DFH28DRAFT_827905, partial [Melampsora americana]